MEPIVFFQGEHNRQLQQPMFAWQTSILPESKDIEECYPTSIESMLKDEKLQYIVKEAVKITPQDNTTKYLHNIYAKYGSIPSHFQLSVMYHNLISKKVIQKNEYFEQLIVTKRVRSASGVMVVTISTEPSKFSCKYNCYYCPSEPGQPKSYLSNEPSLIRANKYHFDAIKQFWERSKVMYLMAHKLDKLEIIVVGGSWACYPVEYQEKYIRDIYFATNTFYDMMNGDEVRSPYDLIKEQEINETAKCRIISITLEMRPDQINAIEIKRLRKYGCTRVQLGIQHTDDEILEKVNRQCYLNDSIYAIKMLKDNGFKIDIHLMPNLPFSTPEKDVDMFRHVIESPDLQADQWKIYPCEVMPYTTIKEWYENGTYKPYDQNKLIDVITYALMYVPPFIRVNRVVRDFSFDDVIAGIESNDLHGIINKEMKQKGLVCNDIRTREVKYGKMNRNNIKLTVRRYPASDGLEYFISHESNDEKIIYSLLRLRIPNKTNNLTAFEELKDCSLIRELHVYGDLIECGKQNNKNVSQHVGLGKELLKRAEIISSRNGLNKIAVISGVGVRNYYKKIGYVFDNFSDHGYGIKRIKTAEFKVYIAMVLFILIIGIVIKNILFG